VSRCELDSCGSRYGPVAGSCKRGNEPSGSIKGREFNSETVSFSRCNLFHEVS
jgi:hypothetical protein